MDEQQTVTRKQAATMLGLGRNTVDRMIARGELESIKLGRRRLIPRRVIEALLNGGQPEGARDDQ
jgi:excisionase family DNA binding protein